MNSENSISWHAHREAEQLADISMIDELKSFLVEKPSKEERSAAYFILGKIGTNSVSQRCATALIKYSTIETDKYLLSNILDRIADIPLEAEVELDPLFLLLNDKRWLVRRSAIQSLKGSENSNAETKLLDVLAAVTDPIDIVFCHSTLNRIGTRKSLPAIKQGLTSRKRDVKMSAQSAIEAIETREDQFVSRVH